MTTLTTDFLQVFTDRRDCFTHLLSLSSEQFALIEAEEYSQVLTLLGRKQEFINYLEELQQLHPDLVRDWNTSKSRLNRGLKAECDELLAETEQILRLLMALERQSTEEISSRKEQSRDELHSMSQASRANTTYGTALASTTGRRLSVDQ